MVVWLHGNTLLLDQLLNLLFNALLLLVGKLAGKCLVLHSLVFLSGREETDVGVTAW